MPEIRGQRCTGQAALPVVDVVVLAPPAPVVVGEAIDLQVLFLAHGRNSSEILVVR